MKAFIIVAISFLVIVLILIVAVALAPVRKGCPPNSEPASGSDTSGSGGYYSCSCKDGFELLNGRCVTPAPPPPPPTPPPPPPPAGPKSFGEKLLDWQDQCVSCFASSDANRVPDEICEKMQISGCLQSWDKLCSENPDQEVCKGLYVPTCVVDYSQCTKGWPRYCDDSDNVCWGDCMFNRECKQGEYCKGNWFGLKPGRCAQKASKNR